MYILYYYIINIENSRVAQLEAKHRRCEGTYCICLYNTKPIVTHGSP